MENSPAGPDQSPTSRPEPSRRWTPRTTVVVGALVAIVLLGIGATLGVALAPQSSAPVNSGAVAPGTVDIGFSRDMVTHHTQGVSMANLEQRNGGDAEVKTVAFDIASTQQTDIGEMNGWLDLWGVPRLSTSTPMAWMSGSGMTGMDGMAGGTATASGSDGAVMPGMATNTEMAKLASLRGTDSDVYFMQLMIRHHQGGAAMMAYAAKYAGVPAVRLFAQKMLDAQTQEIAVMTQMLAIRKAQPLPFPGSAGSPTTMSGMSALPTSGSPMPLSSMPLSSMPMASPPMSSMAMPMGTSSG